MKLVSTALLALAVSSSAALSGGGTVTAVGEAPTALSPETTGNLLETMGITPARATSVESKADDPPAAAEPESDSPDEAKAEEETATVQVAEAGPLDPRKTARQCSTCHGINGIAKIPTAPNIAGSSRGYLESQLKAFRSGKRQHEVMSVIAEGLSDAEIKAVATWYASLKVTVEVPE